MSPIRTALFSLTVLGVCQAQSPTPAGAKAAKAPSAAAMKPEVSADLRQLMRGILFPNSNVIFFAQEEYPAKVPPVPINNPDWPKFVQGLRETSLAAYKAAQSKNMDNIVTAAGDLSTACSNCHDKWREKRELADRCK